MNPWDVKEDESVWIDDNGKQRILKKDDIGYAEQLGYRPATQEEIIARSKQIEYEQDPTTAGVLSVARAGTLGLSDYALPKLQEMTGGDYKSAVEDIRGLKEANPGASFAGDLVGNIALFAATGGVSGGLKALGVDVGKRVLPRLGIGAIEGAIMAGGQEVSSAALEENPNKSAEEILAHVGMGAVFGAGATALGVGAEKSFGAIYRRLRKARGMDPTIANVAEAAPAASPVLDAPRPAAPAAAAAAGVRSSPSDAVVELIDNIEAAKNVFEPKVASVPKKPSLIYMDAASDNLDSAIKDADSALASILEGPAPKVRGISRFDAVNEFKKMQEAAWAGKDVDSAISSIPESPAPNISKVSGFDAVDEFKKMQQAALAEQKKPLLRLVSAITGVEKALKKADADLENFTGLEDTLIPKVKRQLADVIEMNAYDDTLIRDIHTAGTKPNITLLDIRDNIGRLRDIVKQRQDNNNFLAEIRAKGVKRLIDMNDASDVELAAIEASRMEILRMNVKPRLQEMYPEASPQELDDALEKFMPTKSELDVLLEAKRKEAVDIIKRRVDVMGGALRLKPIFEGIDRKKLDIAARALKEVEKLKQKNPVMSSVDERREYDNIMNRLLEEEANRKPADIIDIFSGKPPPGPLQPRTPSVVAEAKRIEEMMKFIRMKGVNYKFNLNNEDELQRAFDVANIFDDIEKGKRAGVGSDPILINTEIMDGPPVEVLRAQIAKEAIKSELPGALKSSINDWFPDLREPSIKARGPSIKADDDIIARIERARLDKAAEDEFSRKPSVLIDMAKKFANEAKKKPNRKYSDVKQHWGRVPWGGMRYQLGVDAVPDPRFMHSDAFGRRPGGVPPAGAKPPPGAPPKGPPTGNVRPPKGAAEAPPGAGAPPGAAPDDPFAGGSRNADAGVPPPPPSGGGVPPGGGGRPPNEPPDGGGVPPMGPQTGNDRPPPGGGGKPPNEPPGGGPGDRRGGGERRKDHKRRKAINTWERRVRVARQALYVAGGGIGGYLGGVNYVLGALLLSEANAVGRTLDKWLATKIVDALKGGSAINAMIEGAASAGRAIAKPATLAKPAAIATAMIFAQPRENETEDEALERLSSDIDKVSLDPEAIDARIDQVFRTLARTNPMVALAMKQKIKKNIQYLKAVAPKSLPRSKIIQMQPLIAYPKSEREKYKKRIKAVFAPMAALEDVLNGTAGIETQETLDATHPEIMTDVRQRLMKHIATVPSLTYAQRIRFERIMGTRVEQSTQPAVVAMLQRPPLEPEGGGKQGSSKLGELAEQEASRSDQLAV